MEGFMEFPGGYKAVISCDSETGMYRGEFITLPGRGAADFYAEDMENLRKEGEISLKDFLEIMSEVRNR